MVTAYVIVTGVAVALTALSGLAALVHFTPIVPAMARVGVPESWLTFPIGTLKVAGWCVAPGAEAGQYRVGTRDGRVQRPRVGGGEVGAHGPYPGRQPVRVAHDRGEVVAGGERLVDELPADAAGGGDDGELSAHAGIVPREARTIRE